LKIYQINTKQNLPISVKEAWEFLSSPNNLAEITPKYMNFKILSGEQRFGPYSLWHHKHFIKEIDGGIEMEDIVDYKIPFGFLGQIAHSLFIEKKLRQIFNYREKKLVKLFGKL